MAAEGLHGNRQQVSGEHCWRSSSVGRVSGPQRLVAPACWLPLLFFFFPPLIFIYLTVLGLSCSMWNLVL